MPISPQDPHFKAFTIDGVARNAHRARGPITILSRAMTDLEITHELNGSKGRYATRPNPDGAEAELTYSRASDKLIIIDHTGVPEEYRGGKVGFALVQRAVEEAREKGHKILPLCPFAAAQFRRHPDWRDVLNG